MAPQRIRIGFVDLENSLNDTYLIKKGWLRPAFFRLVCQNIWSDDLPILWSFLPKGGKAEEWGTEILLQAMPEISAESIFL